MVGSSNKNLTKTGDIKIGEIKNDTTKIEIKNDNNSNKGELKNDIMGMLGSNKPQQKGINKDNNNPNLGPQIIRFGPMN